MVHGKRGTTADTAIRLARYFGTAEEDWMNLQVHYELRSDPVPTFEPMEMTA